MLPTSSSSSALQSTGTLGLPLPPRSSSSRDLSSNPGQQQHHLSQPASGSSTPSFYRSTGSLGPSHGSGSGGGGNAVGGGRDSPLAPPPVPSPAPHSPSPRPVHPSPYPTSSYSTPSYTPTLSNPYHANYDARLVANTINRIESNSGIGAASAGGGRDIGAASGGGGVSQGAESDAWTAVCVRTLPLFNGEGQRGYIEDLNELVSLHVKKSIERHGPSTAVLQLLTSDLVDLLAMGMLTLNAKLTELNDDKLLIRITEVWNFFFIGCLPYIEGIFLPLRTETSIRQIIAANNTRALHSSAPIKAIEPIDIRRIALRSFRDHLVLPIVDRLAVLFSQAPATSTNAQPLEPSVHPQTHAPLSSTARTASARRLQMVSVLVSIQTGDERQAAAEALGKALRAGMDRRPSLVHPLAEHAHGNTSTATTATAATVLGGGLTGLYDAAGYFNATHAGREADRKAWRRGRQIRPGNNKARPGQSQTAYRGASEDSENIPPGHGQGQGDEERHYLDQLRSPDLDSPEGEIKSPDGRG